MERPETDSTSGPHAARRRSSAATESAFVRSIADVPFLLEGADSDRTACLVELTRAWDRDTAPQRTDGAGGMVRIRFVDSASSGPAALATLPHRPPDVTAHGLSVWSTGDGLVIDEPGGCRGVATPEGITLAGTPRLRALERVAGPLLGHVLQQHGLMTLHAAALVLPSGGAVVATGWTGAGKSTLVAIAMLAGWPVLSDDLCVVRPGTVAQVTGIPRAPAVPSEIGAPLNGTPIEWDRSRGRLHLPAELLTRGWYPVVALLRIEHSAHPDSSLSARAPRELFDDLLSSQMATIVPADVRRTFKDAASLTSLPGFTLAHGTDSARRQASGAAQLARLAATVTRTGSTVP